MLQDEKHLEIEKKTVLIYTYFDSPRQDDSNDV